MLNIVLKHQKYIENAITSCGKVIEILCFIQAVTTLLENSFLRNIKLLRQNLKLKQLINSTFTHIYLNEKLEKETIEAIDIFYPRKKKIKLPFLISLHQCVSNSIVCNNILMHWKFYTM